MSFVRRRINVAFDYANGDNLTVTGLRCEVAVSCAGGAQMTAMHGRIYGMTGSQMNGLVTLGSKVGGVALNRVTVLAGDDTAGMATVFSGTIFNAWADYNAQPSVALNIAAQGGLIQQLKPMSPTSYKGAVDVAVVLEKLASQMGLNFENNGVSVQLSNPYLPGAGRAQALAAAAAAGIEMLIDRDALAIWPKGQNRGGQIPDIGPTTGLKGYPTYTQQGLQLECVFNPAIQGGGKVNVTSSQAPACGNWIVTSLDHTLESEKPNGAWFSRVQLVKPGFYGG